MNEDNEPMGQDALFIVRLARAFRCTLVVIVLGVSSISFHATLSIWGFDRIFADMLGGRPLPMLTILVLKARLLFVAVAVLVPIVAVATLFMRGIIGSFYIIAVLMFVTVAELITIYCAMGAPLVQIISAMGGTAGGPP